MLSEFIFIADKITAYRTNEKQAYLFIPDIPPYGSKYSDPSSPIILSVS